MTLIRVDDELLKKIDLQANIVGIQGCKFNHTSRFFIAAGCYIGLEDQYRITLAAQNANNQGEL